VTGLAEGTGFEGLRQTLRDRQQLWVASSTCLHWSENMPWTAAVVLCRAVSCCAVLSLAGLVIITCEHYPAVTESWNAVFQTFKDEPFGVYIAR
jgi:hypothetical protein